MKKILYAIFAIAALAFSSCSNKVDLYSDDGDTTIIYALLDAGADTNFFKITHSFIGNVNELAYDYDANNYKYDEIEVTFTGVFEGSPSTQTILLDTISKWIPYNENAQFYSGCYQTYYYTTKKLKEGQEYTLNVLRKEDNVNISSKATTINAFAFKEPVAFKPITFSELPSSTANVKWSVEVSPYKSTAAYFEVTGFFNYKELMPGAQDTTSHTIKWNMGSGEADKLYNTSSNLPYYVISYIQSGLFSLLENDDYLKNNSPLNVQRWCEKFEFQISGIGEELYNYYLVINSTSAIQDIPNYTNVENGKGIMSSRINLSRLLDISVKTQNAIHDRFENYGFPHVYQ